MNFANHRIESRPNGFSLVEVMLALALVASAMVTLMALVPVGLRSSRNATNSIIMGHIIEDAHEHLEGYELNALEAGPFYYDDEGVYIVDRNSEKGSSDDREKASQLRRLYRVDIRLVSPHNEEIKKNAPDLKAVIMDVTWPVDPQTGEVNGSTTRENKKSLTYFVNALTGPRWSEVDNDFKAKIEF